MPAFALVAELSPAMSAAIDPRDTLARALFGAERSDLIFKLRNRSRLMLGAAAMTSMVCAFLSVTGQVSEAGWGCLAGIPPAIGQTLFVHRALARILFARFETLVFLFLSVVFVICLVDIVQYDPPRVVAVVMVFLGMLWVSLLDARIPSRSKSSVGRRVLSVSIVAWGVLSSAVVLIYLTGQLRDVRYTRVPLFNSTVEIDVANVGFGCYQVIVTLSLKYGLILFRAQEVNLMLVIDARVHLVPLDGQSPSARVGSSSSSLLVVAPPVGVEPAHLESKALQARILELERSLAASRAVITDG